MKKSWSAVKQDADAERVVRMRESGMTIRDIADSCGWSYSRTRRLLIRGMHNDGATIAECKREIAELRQMVYGMRVKIAEMEKRS